MPYRDFGDGGWEGSFDLDPKVLVCGHMTVDLCHLRVDSNLKRWMAVKVVKVVRHENCQLDRPVKGLEQEDLPGKSMSSFAVSFHAANRI